MASFQHNPSCSPWLTRSNRPASSVPPACRPTAGNLWLELRVTPSASAVRRHWAANVRRISAGRRRPGAAD